ncbi:MAG: hypothetical protein RL268_46 [Pseudomonadota bacterium]|jgi:hypothetical protein
MTAIPSKSDFTDASTTEGEFKSAIEALHDYLTGLLGSSGSQSSALSGLGVLGGTTQVRTASYTVTASDRGHVINCSGTWKLWLNTASSLGAGFVVAAVNSGSGIITLDSVGSDTIGGQSTLDIGVKSSCILVSDGSNWLVVAAGNLGSSKGFQLFTSDGQFTPAPGVTKVKATIIGGGGGGGKGGEGWVVDTYYQYAGGSGGSGGQWVGYVDVTPGASMSVTVGPGGAGSNTGNGSAGQASSFGGFQAGGGSGGIGATTSPGASGANGTVSTSGIGFGSSQYIQTVRSRATSSTAAVSYSSTGTNYPGSGGQGEFGPAGSNAAGGVGGLVLIEW